MHQFIETYQLQLHSGTLKKDKNQLELVEELASLQLALFQKKRIFSRKNQQQAYSGAYIWGSYGSGKSHIANLYYQQFTETPKERMHFFDFMRFVHQELKSTSSQDPLKLIAKNFAKTTKLLFFDEFHVNDIADAMILHLLLKNLLAQGVHIIATSNYPPQGLYENGLQRARFIPAIELILEKLAVFHLDTCDYRYLEVQLQEKLQIIEDAVEQKKCAKALFQKLSNQDALPGNLSVLSRPIGYLAANQKLVWFDFLAVCKTNRSSDDYLALAEQFDQFIISGLRSISEGEASMARRFTWLIDILYDKGKSLNLFAKCSIQDLYPQGLFHQEFQRTLSRLTEMTR